MESKEQAPMIHLANDPNASRISWRPSAATGEKAAPGAQPLRRARAGHSWPFLSPHANRADRPAGARNPSNDSGS
jgi:hypothetical protein